MPVRSRRHVASVPLVECYDMTWLMLVCTCVAAIATACAQDATTATCASASASSPTQLAPAQQRLASTSPQLAVLDAAPASLLPPAAQSQGSTADAVMREQAVSAGDAMDEPEKIVIGSSEGEVRLCSVRALHPSSAGDCDSHKAASCRL